MLYKLYSTIFIKIDTPAKLTTNMVIFGKIVVFNDCDNMRKKLQKIWIMATKFFQVLIQISFEKFSQKDMHLNLILFCRLFVIIFQLNFRIIGLQQMYSNLKSRSYPNYR